MKLRNWNLATLRTLPDIYLYVGLGVVLVSAYLPLILFGGIIVDDWGGIQSGLGCKITAFWDCLQGHYPLWANRPLAPIPLVFFTTVFGTLYMGYLIANSMIYIGAVIITAAVLKRITGLTPALFFIYLASFPAISMPIIVSPVVQMTANIAYFYWAVSLYLICGSACSSSKFNYVLGYLFLLFAFLTYEVILPLLALTVFLPYFYQTEKKSLFSIKYLDKFLIPLVLVLGITVVWQKVIAPELFDIVYSRLSLDLSHISREFYSWASVFTVQLPALINKIPRFFNDYEIITSLLLIIFLLITSLHKFKKLFEKNQILFLLIALICFFSSSLIFILSGQGADISGYQSRGLSSTWFSFTIFLSASTWIALALPLGLRIPLIAIIITIGGVNFLTFSIQRDNYIKSWKIQNAILKDASALIQKNSITNALILGNVPTYVPKNFNNEIVFGAPWDFGAALAIVNPKNQISGAVIDTRGENYHQLEFKPNSFLLDGWWEGQFNNLWFYDYDPNRKLGSIYKVNNPSELKNQLNSLGKIYIGSLGAFSSLLPGEKIIFSKDLAFKKSIMESGWGGTEDWGMWSIGDEATIYLPLPRIHYPKIIIDARAFVTKKSPTLSVEIFLNNKPLKTFTLSDFKSNLIEIPLSDEIYKKSFVIITFKIKNATSPKEDGLDPNDDRKLGIGLVDLQFK